MTGVDASGAPDLAIVLGEEPVATRPALAGDVDVEVCVIGGGVAGLTAARELARRGFSVALIEARVIGAGASGRSVGLVAPGFSIAMDRVVERVGPDCARELWTMSRGGADYIRRTIAEAQIKGTKPVPGRLSVNTVDDEAGARRAAERYRRMFGAKSEFWPTARVRATLATRQYFQGVFDYGSFHIHCANYLRGLASAAETAGVRIFENTPALGVDADGVRKRVIAASGRIRVQHVVLAAAEEAERIYPALAGTTMRAAMAAAVTKPTAGLSEAVRFRGAVSHRNSAAATYYVVDDRLLWRAPVWLRGLDRERRMRRDIAAVFPQLEVGIERVWSGTICCAIHRMPQLGPLGPGLWLASAFAQHGLAAATMGGDLIARAIHEGDDRWRLLGDYGLVWAGGRFGRAIVSVGVAAERARDGVREAISRARDALPSADMFPLRLLGEGGRSKRGD